MTRREVLTIKVEEALTDYLMLQRADAFVGFINEYWVDKDNKLNAKEEKEDK